MNKRLERITSSHWGAFKLVAEDGRLVSATPFDDDPDPSAIARAAPAAVHHESRVRRPSVRRGWLEGGADRKRHLRGRDEFVELPWDEALDLAAGEIDRVRRDHGAKAIFGGSYGWSSAGRVHHAQGLAHRFLNCTGGYVASYGNYSFGAAMALMPHLVGQEFRQFSYGEQTSWTEIARATDTLVMFGGIGRKNSQVSMGGITRHEVGPWLEEMRARGAALVNVSPQKSDGWAGSEWLAIPPGTDVALMLGLAHALETEGLTDYGFLSRCASGWEKFRPYLMGEADGVAKTPEWAAAITGLAAEEIRALARRMASTRCFISVSWSMQRQKHGEQPYWMALVLACMLGQIGLEGGGLGYGYGSVGGVGTPVKRLGGPTMPQGRNQVRETIPVARIADMLLNPGAEFDFNGRRAPYPDIRLVYWAGGNPFHHHQDLNRLEEAFRRPDTVIVNEPWWTATAKRADIVFPATTPYEREDVGSSFSDSFLFHMPQMIEPVGEARDDYAIFAGLADRLGCGAAFTEGRDAEGWLRHLYDRFRQGCAESGLETPTLDELRERNFVELPIKGPAFERTAFAAFRADPEGKPLGTASGKFEIFSETIAGFGYAECPGHPMWFAPEGDVRHPLRLVSPQPADKLHSQLECALADARGRAPATLSIHPDDAAPRGIVEGATLRVFNDRGACLATARVTDEVAKGVVVLPTGAWFEPAADGACAQGNPNVLTEDVGTSRLGQGTSAHTAAVEVAPA